MSIAASNWSIDKRETDLAEWSRDISERYFPLESIHVGGAPFEGQLRGRKVGSLTILQCSSTGITYKRTTSHVAKDRQTSYLITVPDRNTVHQTQAGRSNEFRAGSFFIERVHEPYTFTQPTSNSLLTIAVEGRVLDDHLRRSDLYCGIAFDASAGVGRLFLQAARGLLSEYSMLSEAEMSVVGAQLIELVAMSIRDDKNVLGSESSAVRMAHLRRVHDYMRRNLHVPTLTPSDIALANELSVGYLHRLFSDTGSTVSQHLRQLRLESARSLIQNRPELFIGDIGFRCGFPDPATFSRSFKSAFGITPTDLRINASRDPLAPLL